jgi:hypothetical protein
MELMSIHSNQAINLPTATHEVSEASRGILNDRVSPPSSSQFNRKNKTNFIGINSAFLSTQHFFI